MKKGNFNLLETATNEMDSPLTSQRILHVSGHAARSCVYQMKEVIYISKAFKQLLPMIILPHLSHYVQPGPRKPLPKPVTLNSFAPCFHDLPPGALIMDFTCELTRGKFWKQGVNNFSYEPKILGILRRSNSIYYSL
jgi:hypothetical protein